MGAERCSCRASSERISRTAAGRFDERNAEIAEDAEQWAGDVVPFFSAFSALSAFQFFH